MYEKAELNLLKSRIAEPRRFIQVMVGPRQIGKTTIARQLVGGLKVPCTFVAADNVVSPTGTWISQQWEAARFQLVTSEARESVLVIDEIQKIDNWAEVVKAEWDKDSFEGRTIKVVLLGSSRLLLQKGLSESLAGRFETIQVTHWSFREMEAAFGMSIEQFVYFGGYPGAIGLIEDETRWREYIQHSLIESTISRDILMMSRVDKPALLRQLFELGCSYSGQILSYTKLLGQLQDSGNTTTLSHYIQLLDSAGLLVALEKYAPDQARQRASIPKWQVQNAALASVYQSFSFEQCRQSPELWGRCVETAIGTHLVRASRLGSMKTFYWREGNDEVDFVVQQGQKVVGIEVKSGRIQTAKGMAAFQKKMKPDKVLLVGNSGIRWQDFLLADTEVLFRN